MNTGISKPKSIGFKLMRIKERTIIMNFLFLGRDKRIKKRMYDIKLRFSLPKKINNGMSKGKKINSFL